MKNKILFLLLPLVLVACSKPTKDKVFVERYEAHKASFSELLVKTPHCYSSYGVDKEKHKNTSECISLLEKLGVEDISNIDGVDLYTTESTLDYWKGYAYSKNNLKPVFQNLDSIPKEVEPYSNGYKKIDKNWYIYIYNASD